MKVKLTITKIVSILILSFMSVNYINAQAGSDSLSSRKLYDEIGRMDSILFNAFNTRDVAMFASFFTKDLEFYHDKGGLTGYDYTMTFMNDVAKNNNGLRRELVKGSLEVYPIPGYGAMEIGSHKFCHFENGKHDCGTFRFVHIWQKKDGAWKISRVISYDH